MASKESISIYTYTSLPENHIRLLNLYPSDNNDPDSPLSGDLVIVPLFPSPSPFSAISYVWGHSLPSNSSTDFLTTPTGLIRLTPTLFSFLRRLRKTFNQPLLLWADAICINQLDPHEKESQVALMGDIYQAADRVLADLGEETEDSGVALEAMDRYWKAGLRRGMDGRGVGRHLTSEETAMFLDLPLPSGAKEDDGREKGQDDDGDFKTPEPAVSRAVLSFFERPWFSRIWVVQEFVLARAVELFCGTTRVRWQVLFSAGILFEGMPMLWQDAIGLDLGEISGAMSYMCMAYIKRIRMLNETEDGREFVRHLGSLSGGRLVRFYSKPGMMDLLHYLRVHKATLGRDHFFAVLGLASDLDEQMRAELRPDYTSTDDAIIRRFARVLIQKTARDRAAEVFMRAGLWRGTNPELPSWFEDASSRRPGAAFMDLTIEEAAHKAAGDTEFVIDTDPELPDAIILKGHRFDILEEVSPTWGPSEPMDSVAEKVKETLFDYIRKGAETLLKLSTDENDAPRPGPYPTGEALAEAAALTLCIYRGIEALSREVLSRGFWFSCLAVVGLGTPWENHREVFPYTWSDEMAEKITPEIECFATELGTAIHIGLLASVSKKGYFASASPGASIDDEIWIIQGCRLPMILRKNDEPQYGGQYRLVGPCYVHGIMNGEALQDPEFEWNHVSIC